jgi:ADP-heptose:LPS heptosyltransferase
MNNVRVGPTRDHVVDAFLEMLQPLGIDTPHAEFQIPDDPSAHARVAEFLERELAGRRPAMIVPFASWHSKTWPIERYAEVVMHLGRGHGLRGVVTWYAQHERRAAAELVASSEGHAVMAPRTSLLDLAALARRAALFVGPDTGLMHLAAAVGTPCVGLFGPTRIDRSGPYGENHVPLQAYYQPGTRRQRRQADNLAMQAIDADSVCRACDQALLFSPRGGRRYNSAVRQSSQR